MALIVDINDFFKDVGKFVINLIEDNKNSGNIILNPEEKLIFSKLEGNKKVTGKKVIEGLLQDERDFLKMREQNKNRVQDTALFEKNIADQINIFKSLAEKTN